MSCIFPRCRRVGTIHFRLGFAKLPLKPPATGWIFPIRNHLTGMTCWADDEDNATCLDVWMSGWRGKTRNASVRGGEVTYVTVFWSAGKSGWHDNHNIISVGQQLLGFLMIWSTLINIFAGIATTGHKMPGFEVWECWRSDWMGTFSNQTRQRRFDLWMILVDQ